MENFRFITWPAIAGVLAALLILDRWVLPQTPRDQVYATPVSYNAAVRVASPAVVNISTAKLVQSRRNPLLDELFLRGLIPPQAQRQRLERALGSGVIMTRQGHILTNNHVIEGAVNIEVALLDGRTASATVIGRDAATDLAVLKADLDNLQPIELTDSDAARVGDVVLAIGNPLGFGHSVSQGIVSALGRYGLQLNTYEDYIQTDANIHLGNSGGALINASGQLLGINTAFYTTSGQGRTPTGIGLAIPANLASFIMRDLIDYGEVIRGWLGVQVEPLLGQNANGLTSQALMVIAVADEGPAQRAGIMPGDVITHIDNEAVRDVRLTMHRIALLRPGESVGITVLRNTQSIDLKAVVGTLTQSPSA